MKIFNCIFVVLNYLVISSTQPNNKITISIYYETLCSDCVKFISNQLYPVHKILNKYMTLDFVPYGKSRHYFDRRDKKWRFECQHGSHECYGNAVQACVLQEDLTDSQNLEFINCFLMAGNSTLSDDLYSSPPAREMKRHRWEEMSQLCGHIAGVNLNNLYNCLIRSNESSTYLAAYGSRTYNEVPDLDYVPWILFNGHYYDEGEKHLFRVLCSLIQYPQECSKSNKRRLNSLRYKVVSLKKAKKAKKTRKARKAKKC